MNRLTLSFCIVILAGLGAAKDVPFVFDEMVSDVSDYTSSQIEQVYISSPDLAEIPTVTQAQDNETLAFPITGGGNTPLGTKEKNVGVLKMVFDSRVEPENPVVHEEALLLTAKYPGDLTIDQICSIYHYLKNGENLLKGWSYKRDPRGSDYFNYANSSLRLGKAGGYAGAGDCDDFAILMAALIESIGGTTRIILANNETKGGHAYAEVYIGQLNATESQVEDIIYWLKGKFNTGKIYTHIDTDTKDVWLNLDWGADEEGNTHPGGPFYQGDKHIVLCIRDKYVKTPLKLPEVEVVFPDPNLDAKIRKAINKPTGIIYAADLGKITTFGASANDIKNIEGLEYCTNLQTLTLWGSQITDVSPLAGLTKLQTLNLDSNQITDVSPIAGLTNLKMLALEGNQITDVSPLSKLTNLQQLDLLINQISDVSPLSKLTNLQMLLLDFNQITDISPIAGLTNLQWLGLDSNQITDISPIAGLTNLKELALEGNQIIDISPIAGLTNLQKRLNNTPYEMETVQWSVRHPGEHLLTSWDRLIRFDGKEVWYLSRDGMYQREIWYNPATGRMLMDAKLVPR
jgi:hypothetical protein